MRKRGKIVFLLRGREGLGHVSPGAAMAEALTSKGFEVHLLTYGNGIRFLKAKKFKNIYDIREPKRTNGRVPWKDMFEITKDVLPIIKKIKPSIVIVDGECDALFLIKKLGIKLVFLTTTPYIELNFGPWKEYEDYGRAGLEQPDKILVHGIVKPDSKFTNYIYIGPLVRANKYKIKKGNTIPIVIGSTTSAKLKTFAKQSAILLKELGYKTVFIDNTLKGKRFVKEPLEYFSSAPLIITHGGLAVIEEGAVLGKPMIMMYDETNEEKKRNAIIAERLLLGKSINVAKPFNKKKVRRQILYALELYKRI
ncbi:MAG: glycosyltransferase, partial [Nitrososphaeria archaeon]